MKERKYTKFPNKEAELYCMSCQYYRANGDELYDCTCRGSDGWIAAATYVYNIAYCKKYNEEINTLDIKDVCNKIMPFGKFKGKPLKDIEYNYLNWLCKQDWIKISLKKYLIAYRRYLDSLSSSFEVSCDPYDTCPFNILNEVGYGDLC